MSAVKVKPCTVPFLRGTFGITDGKKWFYCTYPTQEAAEAMLVHFADAETVRVNISYPEPMRRA